MVLVDVHFSNGTVRIDISQAAIDFYRKQGVRVELVAPADVVKCDIRVRFDGIPTFENGKIQAIVKAEQAGTCNQTLDVIMSLIDTATGQQLRIITKSKDFSKGDHIVILEANVLPKTVNGEIFVWTRAGVSVSNKITFQVQEGITPPPTEPPTEPPTPTGLGKFDQLVMGALILGAVLPLSRGRK